MTPWQCVIFEPDNRHATLSAWAGGTLVTAPASAPRGASAAVKQYAADHLADRPGSHDLIMVTAYGGAVNTLPRDAIMRRFRVTVTPPTGPNIKVEAV